MEDIIQAVCNEEYETASMLILLNKLDHNDMEKLVYFFVYKLIDKKINETIFVEMINYVNRTAIDISSLVHIKDIIELLSDENYTIATEILQVQCDIKKIENIIRDFLRKFKRCNNLVYNNKFATPEYGSNNDENMISKSYIIVSEADKYIKTFLKISTNLHPSISINKNILISSEPQVLDKKYSKYDLDFIINQFEGSYKQELLDRLTLIVKYFGIIYLSSIGVDIITESEFNAMRYNESIKYYFRCIKKIRKNFSIYLKLYRNYFRLYVHYNSLVFQQQDNGAYLYSNNNNNKATAGNKTNISIEMPEVPEMSEVSDVSDSSEDESIN